MNESYFNPLDQTGVSSVPTQKRVLRTRSLNVFRHRVDIERAELATLATKVDLECRNSLLTSLRDQV